MKKKTIFKIIRYSGISFFFRQILQKNKVTILLFHDIDVETADKIFSLLRDKYNVISLQEYLEAAFSKREVKLPDKALIITFDDGHIGNYKLLPVIKKYNLPVTIFLCASIINTNRQYWFNYKRGGNFNKKLLQTSNRERLRRLSKIGFEQEKEYDNPKALQKWQIDKMKDFINFQSHTLYHPILPRSSDKEAEKEIFESKQILEKKYHLNINAISYPNGDYSERDIRLAKQAGYKCGITVDFGFNTINSDPFKLKRLSLNDSSDLNEIIVKASGFWAFLKKYKKIQQINL